MLERRRRRWSLSGRARRETAPAGWDGAPLPAPIHDWESIPEGGPQDPFTPTPLAGTVTEVPTGAATYIGRAPVFDRRLDVAGYHLIVDRLGEPAGSASPRQLLTRALLEVGLDSLIGGKTGFVEVTVDLLAEGLHHALPAHRMVLEVSGPIDLDGEEVLRDVRDEGYRVLLGSLDACVRPEQALRASGGLRIDLRRDGADAAAALAARHNRRGKVLLDGLAASDDVEPARQLGATWMRGEVLRPVERIDEPTVPSHRLAVLELLAELERPDVQVDDIDRLVAIDLGMSYKVLRMANSSYLALERRVERTRDAVVYLGLDTVRAAAALLALSEASDHPPEIIHQSLLRARHCEEILRRSHPESAHAGFTTGLFSGLDLLLGLEVEQVLQRIPVSDEIAAALRSRTGRLGRTLEVVLAYERHDIAELARSDLEPTMVVLSYRQALGWVTRIIRGLDGGDGSATL